VSGQGPWSATAATGAMPGRATAGQSPRRGDVIPADIDIIVTIDGPAGTGKSTVARELADRLGLDLLDTGAMYRAAAAIAIDHGLIEDVRAGRCERFVELVADADLHFDWSRDPPEIMAWFEPINDRVRMPDVTAEVSLVARIAGLRRHMVRKQRLIGQQHPRLVTEGRDQGSVVFPDALVKFFLDADLRVRATRRAVQLREAGYDADVDELMRDLERRDQADRTREEGPLTCPPEAIVVDTTRLTFSDVVGRLERDVLDRVGAA